MKIQLFCVAYKFLSHTGLPTLSTSFQSNDIYLKHVEIPADIQEQFHKDDELENTQTD